MMEDELKRLAVNYRTAKAAAEEAREEFEAKRAIFIASGEVCTPLERKADDLLDRFNELAGKMYGMDVST